MTRDQLTDEAEDMLFHTRGMSRREQAVALVNTLFWPELAEARAKALDEAATIADKFHADALKWAANVRGLSMFLDETDSSRIAAAIRALKDRAQCPR